MLNLWPITFFIFQGGKDHMKKNLRIVSAAAAALLAVAPVAAAGVVAPASTVSAATASQEATDLGTLRGTIVLDRASNTQFSIKLSDAQKDAILQLGGDALKDAKPEDMKNITVKSASASNSNGEFQQVVTFTVNDKAYQVTLNAKFASQQGTPYFYNKDTNTVVNDDSTVSLNEIANGFSSSDLLSAIQKHYGWKTSDQSNDTINMTTTASEIADQLKAQGISVDDQGWLVAPKSFTFNVTAKSDKNDATATLPVTVNVPNGKDTTVPSQSKTVMHNAYFYDKNGKRVGSDKVTRYNSATVAMSTTTINGKAYYEVIENGKATGKFINAANIDGTKRTLKHNAYVYKSSKKRANKVVLKKGTEVVTYGGAYTFKNGKQYYKIGNNTDKTYVKASNF